MNSQRIYHTYVNYPDPCDGTPIDYEFRGTHEQIAEHMRQLRTHVADAECSELDEGQDVIALF